MLGACASGGARSGAAPEPETPGEALGPGARLVYSGSGREQPAWTIESVEHDFSLGGRDGCARIALRTRPDAGSREVRTLCRGGDTLFSWESTTRQWRALRPVGPGMTLDVPGTGGATLRFTTGERGVARLGGQSFPFVHTTVLTTDAQGRATHRLTERYSVALGTALGGVFEVPDSARSGAWRETQRFELVRVELP